MPSTFSLSEATRDAWRSLARWERRLVGLAIALLILTVLFYLPKLFNGGSALYGGNVYSFRLAGLTAGKVFPIGAAAAILVVLYNRLSARAWGLAIAAIALGAIGGGVASLTSSWYLGGNVGSQGARIQPSSPVSSSPVSSSPLVSNARSVASKPVPSLAPGEGFSNQSGVDTHRIRSLSASLSMGKWYWEMRSPNLGCCNGSVASTASFGVMHQDYSTDVELGSERGGWAWRGDGTRIHEGTREPFAAAAGGPEVVIMIALDVDAGEIWFGVNGTWLGEGDPASGKAPAFSGLKGPLVPAVSSNQTSSGTAVVFADTAAPSWRYPAPTGYRALPH